MKSYKLKIIIFLGIISAVFLLPKISWAATYYISPSGTASWSQCTNINTPCSLSTANTNAVAGDTVYYRGGIYNVDGATAIVPSNTGTGENGRIIFSAYTGETPVFQQADTDESAGIAINGKSWIKITGMTFNNMQQTSYIRGDAHYNEISYCSFTNTTPANQPGSRIFRLGYNSNSPWSTHNWFHHNYLSTRYNPISPCNEGVDLMRVGEAQTSPHSEDNYNTVEYNYFEYGGHATLVTYSKYNVIRSNISHNEPFIPGCTSYNGTMPGLNGETRGSISSTQVTIGIGSKTWFIATGLDTNYWKTGQPVSILYASDFSEAMYGLFTSYNPTTGELVINITKVASGASGTYSNWVVANKNVPYYTDPIYNGLYSHRNFCIGDFADSVPIYTLVEGNRIGFAGVNPNNDGADNLDLSSPKNIARYNFVYGAMASGILFKFANGEPSNIGGVNNRVYNNTSYHNGYGWDATIYGGMNMGYDRQGIAQYSSNRNPANNVIKNNLVYLNGGGDICQATWNTPTCTEYKNDSNVAIDTVVNNWTTYGSGQGDPLFVNPALTDVMSQNLIPSAHGYTTTLIPNLSLQSYSKAIDGGVYLTTASGSGSGSASLTVADAMYFQDGSWGSDLTRTAGTMQADWIAIGIVTNVVQISSINYSANTITLASPMSWNDNAPIWLYKKSDGTQVLYGSAPDYGAYEYASVVSDTIPPAAPSGVTVS